MTKIDSESAVIPGFLISEERKKSFDIEKRFTQTYQKYQNATSSKREIECLKVLFPAIMNAPDPSDYFAGRITYPFVGFSPEPCGLGYYCAFNILKSYTMSLILTLIPAINDSSLTTSMASDFCDISSNFTLSFVTCF